MTNGVSILFVGESCFATTTEFKGVDHFSETNYHTSEPTLRRIYEVNGNTLTHIPCHMISRLYPRTLEELRKYDVVLFSDVGTNSFLLLPEMVRTGNRIVNLLKLTKQYVAEGGGFGMIGGYMTFQGMEGKGKWKNSPMEDILPVSLLYGDDRTEVPEGADLTCVPGSHPVVEGLPAEWPYILGYNKTIAKPGANVIVEFEGDPIIALGEWGKGRTLAYTTDLTPHWAPAAMNGWELYPTLWSNLVRWLANK